MNKGGANYTEQYKKSGVGGCKSQLLAQGIDVSTDPNIECRISNLENADDVALLNANTADANIRLNSLSRGSLEAANIPNIVFIEQSNKGKIRGATGTNETSASCSRLILIKLAQEQRCEIRLARLLASTLAAAAFENSTEGAPVRDISLAQHRASTFSAYLAAAARVSRSLGLTDVDPIMSNRYHSIRQLLLTAVILQGVVFVASASPSNNNGTVISISALDTTELLKHLLNKSEPRIRPNVDGNY
ncbi:hypothetical protein LSAT2_022729 [Lamellibrachia satsuma]|nr:hypothetical protein LSAT2_022729 [Lamellibrachia satsuma]